MGKIERPDFGRPAEAGANVWDVLFRVAAVCLGVLLVLAYVTGEEFQHTHVLIGYGLDHSEDFRNLPFIASL